MNIDTLITVHMLPGSREAFMSRVQLALNVSDIDEAVAFYAKLFATEPAKRREGYANFAVESPPLKLVLIENPEAEGRLNHLGVEVFSTDEVAAAQARLADDGLATATQDNVTCCYAVQDKVWVDDPDGSPWEIYTVLADSPTPTDDTCATTACAITSKPADDDASATVAGCC
jgi:catechol 2,3-dioxygenase-like lactoylglutathione lyase family enzyme